MSDRLLVLNAGSSSLKFALFDGGGASMARLAEGSLARMGSAPHLSLRVNGTSVETRAVTRGPVDLPAAATLVFDELDRLGLLEGIAAVGHRIVHGGTLFTGPVRLDAEALDRLEHLVPLAPLHQPHNLAIVRFAAERLPQAVQIGCFDTAFHADRPRLDKLYALPRELTDQGIIAYGFHGLSYAHVAQTLRELDGPRAGGRSIVAHLGSGASLCAMDRGASVATTMGFSALDGLMMATRCGAIDPGVLLHLMDDKGMDAAALSDLLYNQSGLLGMSGISGDMQVLLESAAPQAAEAVDLYLYRAVRAIGSLVATLGGLDSLVFTAGVGENSPVIRQRICAGAAWLGVEVDAAANQAGWGVISLPTSRVTVHVIPADEELAIAQGMVACLAQTGEG
ncbi:acetate/propionate family kinase [Altererythrobacter sp. KTW20L]|uniref:acetate/propionate family kinase n=1 Tax=Altererythrobacter sp. KTW20L TaxID=2942210 RepID=UPI0020BDE48C|nr:acetate/propionate family kinase [Altererythrobacter sp. KTW20L]MCL6250287.1 acetate/propionate family kinase [Altererythrobacter sp. KTW20L]